MTEHPLDSVLTVLLGRIAGGTAEAEVDGTWVATLDGERRNLTVDVDTLLGGTSPERVRRRGGHLSLWQSRGVPATLARLGWQVSVVSESRELLRMGRGVSRLTGRVWTSPTALWRLRRIL